MEKLVLKENLSKNEMLKMIEKEEDVLKIFKVSVEKTKIKLVVPKISEIKDIISYAHNKLKHRGRDPVLYELGRNYYFPSLFLNYSFIIILLFKCIFF